MDQSDRERRLKRRIGRRILFGGVVGALVGAGLGLVVGLFVVEPWTAAHWAIAFAGAILGGGIATVQGGLAGLEPGNPGAELSAADDPLREERGWISTERDERGDDEPTDDERRRDGLDDGSA